MFILEQFHIDESTNKMSLSTVNALVVVVAWISDSNTRISIGTDENNINDSNDNKSDSFCIVPEG